MMSRVLLVCVLLLWNARMSAQSSSQPTLPTGVTTCTGEFALCAASTCTPVLNRDGTPTMMRVRTDGGGVAEFPEMSCLCPRITGKAIADLNGGNMRGSCTAPSQAGVWSLFKFEQSLPQQMNDWATNPSAKTKTVVQTCAGTPGVQSPVTNCFSMACTKVGTRNGVPVADCRCPLSETFAGAPWTLGAGWMTQAGQGNPTACQQFPIGAPILGQ